MLVHTERGHILEPGLVRGELDEFRSTARHTVFHDVPSWRRMPLMVACSRRNCPTAQPMARFVFEGLGVGILRSEATRH